MEAARIPWPQLLKGRKLYVKWQAFLLWVRAIEDTEDSAPPWLGEAVSRRCPGFARFAESRGESNLGDPSSLWDRLEHWINEHIFAKPRREGWMDAVGYYAVRDIAAVRDEAYWHFCEHQWKRSKPAAYPTFAEWHKASENCADEVADGFETTDELRELLKLSRRVSRRLLSRSVDRYVEWQVFAYWARSALESGEHLPHSVSRELRRRCPGFIAHNSASSGNEQQSRGSRFTVFRCWIEQHEFARARAEGWLPVVIYQAHLHPRYQRVVDYWHEWHDNGSTYARSRYPSFEQWKAAADAYTFEHEDA